MAHAPTRNVILLWSSETAMDCRSIQPYVSNGHWPCRPWRCGCTCSDHHGVHAPVSLTRPEGADGAWVLPTTAHACRTACDAAVGPMSSRRALPFIKSSIKAPNEVVERNQVLFTHNSSRGAPSQAHRAAPGLHSTRLGRHCLLATRCHAEPAGRRPCTSGHRDHCCRLSLTALAPPREALLLHNPAPTHCPPSLSLSYHQVFVP